jgi:hypothetical protein
MDTGGNAILTALGLRACAAALFLAPLVAFPSRAGTAAEPGEGRVRKELAVGETVKIGVLDLDQATVYEVLCKGDRLALLLETDGVVQFISVGTKVDVSVTGTRGNRSEFSLSSNDLVSAWPMRWLVVRRTEDGFTLEAEAAGWAFVVSAHRTGEEGLDLVCDGVPSVVKAGERLDVDREEDGLAFRVIDEAWPGKLVGGPEVAREPVDVARRPRPPVRPLPAEVAALPPLPFILTGWGAWEIQPPPEVSP